MPPTDPFGDWLAARCKQDGPGATARLLEVSTQRLALWRKGSGVSPARMPRVKRLAMRDGVILTTDNLLHRRKS